MATFTVAKLEQDIKTFKATIANKKTTPATKKVIEAQLAKAETMLDKMKKEAKAEPKQEEKKPAAPVKKPSYKKAAPVAPVNKSAKPAAAVPAVKKTSRYSKPTSAVKKQTKSIMEKLGKDKEAIVSRYKGRNVDIPRDSHRKAKPFGKRRSAEGNIYYENRPNRGDVRKKNPYLAKGGQTEISDEKLRELAKTYEAEYGDDVLGFVCTWQTAEGEWKGMPVVYGAQANAIGQSYIVVSGIDDGTELVNCTESCDDWFANEIDALRYAYELSKDENYGLEEYAAGGEITDHNNELTAKAIKFLKSKGYSIDAYSTANQDAFFEVDDETLVMVQGSKYNDGNKPDIGIAYFIDNFEEPISKKMLRHIAKEFGVTRTAHPFSVTLYTNAGVEVHSKEMKNGMFDGIKIEKVSSDDIQKLEKGGSTVVYSSGLSRGNESEILQDFRDSGVSAKDEVAFDEWCEEEAKSFYASSRTIKDFILQKTEDKSKYTDEMVIAGVLHKKYEGKVDYSNMQTVYDSHPMKRPVFIKRGKGYIILGYNNWYQFDASKLPELKAAMESGKYEKGGEIPNNYKDKTGSEVWNSWNDKQRGHFLLDHLPESGARKWSELFSEKDKKKSGDWYGAARDCTYSQLPDAIQQEIKGHVISGQYEKGGAIKNQYYGMTPYEVWKSWTKDQKAQFLMEHNYELGYKKEEVDKLVSEDTGGLPALLFNQLRKYIREGMVNQYQGKSAGDVWNAWNERQRAHFLMDHGGHWHETGDMNNMKFWRNLFDKNEVANRGNWIVIAQDLKFSELPKPIQEGIKRHVIDGQYEDGGQVEGKNLYKAFYKGKELDVKADTTYAAQKKAAELFKAKKSYDVTVMLMQLDGKDYVHSTAFEKGGYTDSDNPLKTLVNIQDGKYKKGSKEHDALSYYRESDPYKLTSHEKSIRYENDSDTFYVDSVGFKRTKKELQDMNATFCSIAQPPTVNYYAVLPYGGAYLKLNAVNGYVLLAGTENIYDAQDLRDWLWESEKRENGQVSTGDIDTIEAALIEKFGDTGKMCHLSDVFFDIVPNNTDLDVSNPRVYDKIEEMLNERGWAIEGGTYDASSRFEEGGNVAVVSDEQLKQHLMANNGWTEEDWDKIGDIQKEELRAGLSEEMNTPESNELVEAKPDREPNMERLAWVRPDLLATEQMVPIGDELYGQKEPLPYTFSEFTTEKSDNPFFVYTNGAWQEADATDWVFEDPYVTEEVIPEIEEVAEPEVIDEFEKEEDDDIDDEFEEDVEPAIPAHFGSGRNISVFEYETKNFDVCGMAVTAFENAITVIDIEEDSVAKTGKKQHLAKCAQFMDAIFGIEKEAVANNFVPKSELGMMTNALQMVGIHAWRSVTKISTQFLNNHVYEIAIRVQPENIAANQDEEAIALNDGETFAKGGNVGGPVVSHNVKRWDNEGTVYRQTIKVDKDTFNTLKQKVQQEIDGKYPNKDTYVSSGYETYFLKPLVLNKEGICFMNNTQTRFVKLSLELNNLFEGNTCLKVVDKYAAGGNVGGFEYKTVKTNTVAGLRQAERMKNAGWNILTTGFDSIQFERAKKKALADGGELDDDVEYQSVRTNTPNGKKKAEQLLAKGWKVSAEGVRTTTFERPSKKEKIITSLADLPADTLEQIDARQVTYRGRGMSKAGTLLRVHGKEYIISRELFRELGWIDKIRFSAPARRG